MTVDKGGCNTPMLRAVEASVRRAEPSAELTQWPPNDHPDSTPTDTPAGYLTGCLHGLFLPIRVVASLFMDIEVIAAAPKWSYWFGLMLGIMMWASVGVPRS